MNAYSAIPLSELVEISGDRPSEERREARASNPDVCLLCGVHLEHGRPFGWFCSARCAGTASRRGDGLDKYRRLRKIASHRAKAGDHETIPPEVL